MATPPAAPPRVVAIKKESPDDEIKEYAETAMNELLGWYGYDKVDSRDTQGLNLHHFSSHSQSQSHSDAESSDVDCARSSASRDAAASPPQPAEPSSGCTLCAWCQKLSSNKHLFALKTASGGQKAFCSEVCFTQCRRANFKRNKTCDWCRHVRHTVNYVDFQDGEHQLQFCSDKCLNQYKMNIFCKEAQAHLQLHPQHAGGGGGGGGGGALITPDLWLRDCRSESPTSDRSSSPQPPPPEPVAPPVEMKSSRRQSRPRRSTRSATVTSTASSPRSAGSVSPPKPPLPPHGAAPPPLPPPHLLGLPPDGAHLARPPFLPPPGHLLRPRGFQPVLPPRPMPPPPPAAPPFLPRPLLPPVTVMVPYPILIPVPIPLPIPIPLFMPKEKAEAAVSSASSPAASSAPAVTNPAPTPPPTQTLPQGADRPLRKRKRLTETVPDDEALSKRKSVPV